jgi:hypothetical protein
MQQLARSTGDGRTLAAALRRERRGLLRETREIWEERTTHVKVCFFFERAALFVSLWSLCDRLRG